jgi:tetratricopeptide (TPR) repeat protein
VSLDAQSSLYRSLLAGKRVLIMLDNARDSEQVRPLLPAASGCVVVVTTRSSFAGMVATDDVHPVQLGLLFSEQARELLALRLGRERVAAEPQAADEIIARCARLPLALAVVSARAALQPGRPLCAVADELRQASESLEIFASDDPVANVQAVFSWSYDILSDDAARLFRLLAQAPGPDISEPAVASLAGLPVRRVQVLLAELVGTHLLAERADGRYTFHDLLRTYAYEQACGHDSGEERRAALRRLLDHYLHTAYAADRLMYPQRDPISPIPPGRGVRPETIADYQQALAWFTAERPTLLAAVGRAHQHGLHTHSWQLAWALMTFFDRQGNWGEWAAAQEKALDAARALADSGAQALSHRILGRALTRLGRYGDAHSHLKVSVELHGELGDNVGAAHAHMNIGEAYCRQNQLTDALNHTKIAFELYLITGHEMGQANALNNTGWLYAQLGDYEQALQHCDMALVLHRRNGDVQGQATTWDSLGDTRKGRGEYADAIACYEQALARYRELGSRYYEALALINLGDTYYLSGQHEQARTVWPQALDILTEFGHPDAADVLERLRHPGQKVAD